MAEEPSGFLGRWSRRKTDLLQGKALDEVPAATKPLHSEAPGSEAPLPTAPPVNEPPALSLDDVKLLHKDSDFKPFMAQNVGTDVRNAAMKKLFADPQFNVMDGLDIYIDDYSKSDPIPEAMLRAMTSSKFLKLFDEEEDKDGKKDNQDNQDKEAKENKVQPDTGDENQDPAARDNASSAQDQTVAQSIQPDFSEQPDAIAQVNSSQPELLPDGIDTVASQKDHDHSHLRLQPDHAAPAPVAGRGT